MLRDKQAATSTIFWVFGKTRPGIEPQFTRTFGEHSTH